MYENKDGSERLHCNFVISLELYEIIKKVSKTLFLSNSEFYRFCVVNTLIHLSENELLQKLDLYDVKRYFKVNEKEVEINGNIYMLVEK